MGSLDTGDLQFGNARDRNSRTHDCSAPCVKLLGDPQQPAAIAIRHASPRCGRRRAAQLKSKTHLWREWH